MRWLVAISIVAAVLGIALGVGLTWAELGPYSKSPAHIGLDDSTLNLDPAKPLPRAVVENDTYDFGFMEQDTKGSHTFEIKNEGDAPLTLVKGSTSCKCTLSKLENDEVRPGKSAKVHLEWTAIASEGAFRQTATVRTNDPRRQYVTFTIEGRVSRSHKVAPNEVYFTSINVGDGATGDLYVYSYDSGQFQITEHEFTERSTSELFDLRIEEMPAEQVAKESGAKAGKIVRIVVKPGLPLGEIRQKIRLTLDVPGTPTVEVPIQGRVVGDISIVGPSDWDDQRSLLDLGIVRSDEGAQSRDMYLLVKGQHRDEVNLKVHEIRPDFLQIEFEEPQPLPQKRLLKVPFTIKVAPGAPVGEHNGTLNRPVGKIELDTGHPASPRLRLLVTFVVQK